MNRIAVTLLLVFGIAAGGMLVAEQEPIDLYLPHVQVLHPYETFSAIDFEDPDGIFTRDNYDLYLEVHARHYREKFTVDELRDIAGFFASDLGQRFLEFHREASPFNEFLEQIRDRTNADLDVWTCSDHPQIRIPNEGKCPICQKDLVPGGGA